MEHSRWVEMICAAWLVGGRRSLGEAHSLWVENWAGLS